MAYKAFLSYSHAADARLAPALQGALERFAKPWYRMRSFRIFRDGANLSATPDLWQTIERALDSSEYYILLASPLAAQSQWVRKELTHWLAHKGARTVLIVLTSGTIVWNDAASDFDWDRTDALPRALSGVFTAEPLFIDCSAASPDSFSLNDKKFLNDVASVAATLHGKSKDEIFGEHIRHHRRTLLIARSTALIFAGLLWLTYWQYGQAVTQRNEARKALSEDYLYRGLAAFGRGEVDAGVLWLSSALPILPTQYTDLDRVIRLNLANWSERLHAVRAIIDLAAVSPDGASSLALSPGGDILLTATNSEVRRWDTRTGMPLGEPINASGERVTFSPDGARFVVSGISGSLTFETHSGRHVGARLPHAEPRGIVFSPDGRMVIVGGDEAVRFFEVAAAGLLATLPLSGESAGLRVPMAVRPGGGELAVSDGRRVRLIDLRTYRQSGELTTAGNPSALAYSPDGARLLVTSASASLGEGTVSVWNLSERRVMWGPSAVGELPTFAQFLDDRSIFVGDTATGAGLVTDTSAVTRTRVVPLTRQNSAGGVELGVAFISPDGALSFQAHGTPEVGLLLSTRNGQQVGQPLVHSAAVTAAAIDPGSTVLGTAVAGRSAHVKVWDLRRGEPRAALELDSDPTSHGAETIHALTFAGDDRLVIITQGRAERFEARTLQGRAVLAELFSGNQEDVEAARIGPQGRLALVERRSGEVRARNGSVLEPGLPGDERRAVWDLRSGRRLGTYPADVVCFGRDDDTLLVHEADSLRVWSIAKQQYRGSLLPVGRGAGVIAASRDGARLAVSVSGKGGDSLHMWDLTRGVELGPPLVHGRTITALAFSPDGRFLASASDDKTVRIIDAETGRATDTVMPHPQPVKTMTFSADAGLLATLSADERIRIWDARLAIEVVPSLDGGYASSATLAFNPSATLLAFAGGLENRLRVWDLRPAMTEPPDQIVSWARLVTGQRLAEHGAVVLLSAREWRELHNATGRTVRHVSAK